MEQTIRNIWLTGDTHGRFDRIARFCEETGTTREDLLIILGDAGINFSGEPYDPMKKDYLSALPITLLCIHGNHERRPQTIDTYAERDWRGGKVYAEARYPTLLFAKDGEVYDLNGQQAIAIGGAYSIDWVRRTEGVDWWPDEQPSAEVKARVEAALEARGWQVDVVLSHTTPFKHEPFEIYLRGVDQTRVDKSTEMWLDAIEDRLTYRRWFCGHHHLETTVDRVRVMFNDYALLE